jgi:GNAT superfamily N-acetyltransferase
MVDKVNMEDIPDLVRLMHEIYGEEDTFANYLKEKYGLFVDKLNYAKMLIQSLGNKNCLLLAGRNEEGAIVGMAQAFLTIYPLNPELWMINLLTCGVHQNARKTKVGKELISSVEQWGRENGALAMVMNVPYHNSVFSASVPERLKRMGFEECEMEFIKKL